MIRDKFECQYCGATSDLTIDHIVPLSRGGKSLFENCVTACKLCNSKKTNKLPNETGFHLKKKPTAPTINEFIRFKSDKLGITELLKSLGIY